MSDYLKIKIPKDPGTIDVLLGRERNGIARPTQVCRGPCSDQHCAVAYALNLECQKNAIDV